MVERIEVDPKVLFGKPCVAGTRIPVQNVLELIEEGISLNEIVQHYYPRFSSGSGQPSPEDPVFQHPLHEE
jgi:hypothetical protein